jgi:D-alanyl-D-alanine carboxypeptidase
MIVAIALPFAASTPSASAALGTAPPACRYADVLTTYRNLGDWQRTLLDTIYRLPGTYAPRDLTSTANAGLPGFVVRRLVIADLARMATAARLAGARLGIQSAYRSYANQQSTFAGWVATSGLAAALRASARPGHSEHQLGTAIDFKSYGGPAPWGGDWATTRAGAWMARNAWRYGFIMSYPRGVSPAKTCYSYEPWHYRYFGPTVAAEIHASGLTSREWLWRHGSITGGPLSAPATSTTLTPSPTASSTPSQTPLPSGAPTPVPTPLQSTSPAPSLAALGIVNVSYPGQGGGAATGPSSSFDAVLADASAATSLAWFVLAAILLAGFLLTRRGLIQKRR